MSHVVVSFCVDAKALEESLALPASDPSGFPHRAVRIAKQAEALGAKLCAFGPRMIAFAFQDGDLEEAVALAAQVVREEPKMMAGLSQGELIPIQADDTFASLSWGRALAVAAALSESAKPSEVLIDPEVPGVLEVARSDGTRWVSGGSRAISAISLDVAQPLLQEAVDPFEGEDALSQSGTFAATAAAEFADQARLALIRGDIEMLDSALAQLKPTGTHPALVERLAGLLALDRGAKHEGLRTLRQAAESEARPAVKTRARLAYAIALATAGRPETALLEGLSALSLARSGEDQRGEVAVARFLSQLSGSTGHQVAAGAWERLAENVGLAQSTPPQMLPVSMPPDAYELDESPPSNDARAVVSIELDDPLSDEATYIPDGKR